MNIDENIPAYSGSRNRSARIKIQYSNHWAKNFDSLTRLSEIEYVPTSYAKSAKADYRN